MNPNEIEFKRFDMDALRATEAEWCSHTEDLAFRRDIGHLFRWVEDHMEHKDGCEVAYGIFRGGENVAEGICEVVVTRPGKVNAWVKHLRLWLNPLLDERLDAGEPQGVQDAIGVFSHSLVGVMGIKMDHKASRLKVYGRTNIQLSFLQQVEASIKGKFLDRHDISIQGRFLVIADK